MGIVRGAKSLGITMGNPQGAIMASTGLWWSMDGGEFKSSTLMFGSTIPTTSSSNGSVAITGVGVDCLPLPGIKVGCLALLVPSSLTGGSRPCVSCDRVVTIWAYYPCHSRGAICATLKVYKLKSN